MNVAQLKQLLNLAMLAVDKLFPRSNERGSIEARNG